MKDTEYFGSIWQLYSQLEPSLQPELRLEVIAYLHRSKNIIDARRVSLLFSEVDATQWTPIVLTSAVTAHLRLGRRTEALSLYHEGLSAKGIAGGLNKLLQYAFSDADWDTVKDVWVSYHASDAYSDSRVKKLRFSVPNIGKLVIDFARFIRRSKMDEEVAHALNVLLRQAAEAALRLPCEPEAALPLLQIVDSADMYVSYFRLAWRLGQRNHLPDIYRAYRKLANTEIPYGMLRCMFEVFDPDDVLGLEQVYEDLCRTNRFDLWAFKKYASFYASRGDVRSLERLADAHGSLVRDDKDYYLHRLLSAYATVGYYKGARIIFDKIRSRGYMTVKSWNMLLKSCLKEATYNRAKSVFKALCNNTRPNAVTFTTIMSMAASKGDLEFTLNLFQQAQEQGVETDVPILHSVVRAYCLNDRFQEALATCIEAKNTNVPGDHVRLWNTLLRRYSDRREFDEVCGIVVHMEQHNIQMTPETHKILLKALVDCKQAHPAYKVLRSLLREGSTVLGQEHFTTILEGGLRLRQLKWANKLDRMMRLHAGLSPSVDFRLAQARALLKNELFGKRQQPSEEVDAAEELIEYMRELTDDVKATMGTPPGDSNAKHSAKSVDSLFRLRQLFVKAEALLIRYHRFDSVRELRELRANLRREGVVLGPKDPSIDLLYSHMRENVHEKKYIAAKKNWGLIWEQALAAAQPALSPEHGQSGILPRYRYILSKPFETVQQVFVKQGDADSLKTTLGRLLDAGFLLDNHAMNHTCQILARMGLWLDACKLCEQYLMQNWTGWQSHRIKRGLKVNIPLEQRRIGSAPQWLRPTSYTLMVLAKEYGNLERMKAWSADAAKTSRTLQEECPAVVSAIRNMPYTGDDIELDVLGEK